MRSQTLLALLGRRPDFDEIEGIDFFRTRVENEKYEHLTLRHLYVCRSLVSAASFYDSDIFQRVNVWSDIDHVDFSGADLHGSDLRKFGFRSLSV